MKNTVIFLTLFSSTVLADVRLTDAELQYETLIAFNSTSMTEKEAATTEGEAGPIVAGAIGAIGGATMSIASDVQAGNSINWSNVGINAGAGFVAGASGAWMGGFAGGVAGVGLGASAWGAMSSCSGCH
ncbi:hypothetical protein [Vibrio nomapromontoriensis]|uniref:hypothetical protein n=1 Tax=Vibrio nomapromontoriensis TaxID=2910246 RepID=UPI003D105C87